MGQLITRASILPPSLCTPLDGICSTINRHSVKTFLLHLVYTVMMAKYWTFLQRAPQQSLQFFLCSMGAMLLALNFESYQFLFPFALESDRPIYSSFSFRTWFDSFLSISLWWQSLMTMKDLLSYQLQRVLSLGPITNS